MIEIHTLPPKKDVMRNFNPMPMPAIIAVGSNGFNKIRKVFFSETLNFATRNM